MTKSPECLPSCAEENSLVHQIIRIMSGKNNGRISCTVRTMMAGSTHACWDGNSILCIGGGLVEGGGGREGCNVYWCIHIMV